MTTPGPRAATRDVTRDVTDDVTDDVTRHATRTMKARHESVCPRCQLLIRPGDLIAKLGVWQHVQHILDQQQQETP
jgi:hypothetical protein